MQIHCRRCQALIDADNLQLDRMLAKCRQCNSVFSFADKVPQATAPATERPVRRTKIELPTSMRHDDWGDRLEISRSWFSYAVFFLIFFCIFWDGFLIMWYAVAFSTGAPFFFFIFPLIHVTIGLGLTYAVLTMLFNRTYIRADAAEVVVEHRPIPCLGNKTVPAADIDQLYVLEETRHRKHGRYFVYDVVAMMKDGSKVILLDDLSEANQALYIEQEIEKVLRITNRPVKEEYAG